MSDHDATARPESTDPPETAGETPPAPSKKTTKRLELIFHLPFGPGQPFSEHELVLRDTNPNLTIMEIADLNNPYKLKAFINDNFTGVTQLGLEFCLAESVRDLITRLQLYLCFYALLPLAEQCAFGLKAEYYGADGPPDKRDYRGGVDYLSDDVGCEVETGGGGYGGWFISGA